ncbi:hypothetical protein AX16_002808 [Volvariella volvacea WC 439]|nr:hypothetical protein AX16_002808 [Volvariella volvacea WC 439]
MSLPLIVGSGHNLAVPQIDECLRHLKTLRNARAPISELPAEILLKITFIYKLEYEETGIIASKRTAVPFLKMYGWIVITHVRHHWREIALEYPALWTTIHIPIIKPEWLDKFLRRSRSMPLSMLNFNFYSPGDIEDDLSRSLKLDPDDPNFPISERMGSLLKSLEELSIWDDAYGDVEVCGMCKGLINLVASIPSLPRLKSLLFKRSRATPRISSFFAIRSHSLNCVNHCPNLQELRLCSTLGHLGLDNALEDRPPPITFPRLQVLLIEDKVEEVLEFHVGVVDRKNAGVTEFFKYLSENYFRNPLPQFKFLRLDLSHSFTTQYRLQHFLILLDSKITASQNTAQYSIGVQIPEQFVGSIESMENSLLQFFQSLSLDSLRGLILYGKDFHPLKPLLSRFSTLPLLHTIYIIEGSHDFSILHAMMKTLPLRQRNCVDDNTRRFLLLHEVYQNRVYLMREEIIALQEFLATRPNFSATAEG